MAPSALDTFGRPLHSLRLSVTDRCNLRCAYCMPEEQYDWVPSAELLTFEELSTVVDTFIQLGVRKVRLTGGEPLMRRELDVLVGLLAKKPLEVLALTTNGTRLRAQARRLAAAGLTHLTVSLDTLSPDRFFELTRRRVHADVLDGLDTAAEVGFRALKIDTVVMRGVNDDELVPLLDFAAARSAELRFIEYMDVGGATRWSREKVVSRHELLTRLTAHFGEAPQALHERGSAPAERFQLPDGRVFGIIASTTAPFCGACDRARLTAEGHLLTCLYAREGLDLRALVRSGAGADELAHIVRQQWSNRADRGAERRHTMGDQRTALFSAAQLAESPLLEMHRRGG